MNFSNTYKFLASIFSPRLSDAIRFAPVHLYIISFTRVLLTPILVSAIKFSISCFSSPDSSLNIAWCRLYTVPCPLMSGNWATSSVSSSHSEAIEFILLLSKR